MSAPSDGARADARKRLAEEVVAPDEQIMRALVARFHDPDVGTWSGHSTVPATCFMCTEAATELAGVIADAKAEAWDKGWAAGRRDWWNETRTSNPYRSESGR